MNAANWRSALHVFQYALGSNRSLWSRIGSNMSNKRTFEDHVILVYCGWSTPLGIRPAGRRTCYCSTDENMHASLSPVKRRSRCHLCPPVVLWEAGERIRKLFAVETGELEDA